MSVSAHMSGERLLIGTYPHQEPNVSAPEGGVWSCVREPISGELGEVALVGAVPSASFLAWAPTGSGTPRLLNVDETQPGAVSAWTLAAELEATVESGGSFPCHLAVAHGWVLVANYGDGAVSARRLDHAGLPTDEWVVLPGTGSGPVADRQEGPHAHMVAPLPETSWVWVTDLGADRIRLLEVTADAVRDAGDAVRLPAGTGPRHVAWLTRDRAAVVGELDGAVWLLAVDPHSGRAEVLGSCPLPSHTPAADLLPSHVATGSVLGRLYVTTRGDSHLHVVQLTADARALEPIADLALPAPWPRHHAVRPVPGGAYEDVVIALERGGGVCAMRVPTGVVDSAGVNSIRQVGWASLPSPACVLAAEF